MSHPALAVRTLDNTELCIPGRLVAYSLFLRQLCDEESEELPTHCPNPPVLLEGIDGPTLRWVRDFLQKNADATEAEEESDEGDPWEWEEAFFDFPLSRFVPAFAAARDLAIDDLRGSLCRAFQRRFARQGGGGRDRILRAELRSLGPEGLEELLKSDAPGCLDAKSFALFAEAALGAGVVDPLLIKQALEHASPADFARWGDARLLREVASQEGLTDADVRAVLLVAAETGDRSVMEVLGDTSRFRELLAGCEGSSDGRGVPRPFCDAVKEARYKAARSGKTRFLDWLKDLSAAEPE